MADDDWLVEEYLCVHDKRSPYFDEYDEEPREPRVNCACDNCFYGRDKLALHIAELKREMRARDEYRKMLAQADSDRIAELEAAARYLREKCRVRPVSICRDFNDEDRMTAIDALLEGGGR